MWFNVLRCHKVCLLYRVYLFFALLCASFALPDSSVARWVVDEMHRKVFVVDSPKRIVSLAANLTEILFDLGLGKRIVGVTQFSDYPAEATLRPKVGSFVNLNIEKIVSLNPELIVGTKDGNSKESISTLETLGYSVYIINPKTIRDILQSILHIGQIAGCLEAAKKRVDWMTYILEATRRLLKERRRPRIFLQIGVRPLVTAGKGTFQDNLIRFAGGSNIAGDQRMKYPHLSIEEVIVKKPEVIVLTSMRRGGDFSREKREWMRWRGIPAVDHHRVHVIDSDIVDRPSPRIVLGLLEMIKMIHPDLSEKIDALSRRYPQGPLKVSEGETRR